MKKLFRKLTALVAVLLLVLIFAEAILRLSYRIVDEPGLETRFRYVQSLYAAIYQLWNSGPKTDPFLPPYQVFSNKNASDPERLREIANQSKLPPSSTFQSYDFLQFDIPPGETRYVVRTNSLGFRGQERSIAKPKGLYRILALGSYPTFGLGVNDDETFSAQLEEQLNRQAAGPRRYEVWNGGRPAGTAIIALARLQHELLAYDPDLIILNYGFVDGQIFGDNLLLVAAQVPKGLIQHMFRPFLKFFEYSYLAARVGETIANGKFKNNMLRYYEVMQKIESLCREKRVPVIVLNQITTGDIPRQYVQSPQLNIGRIFLRYPPSADQYQAANRSSWIHRLPADATNQRYFSHYPYRLNGLQLNKDGYRAIAQALAVEVKKLDTKRIR